MRFFMFLFFPCLSFPTLEKYLWEKENAYDFQTDKSGFKIYSPTCLLN